MVEGYRSQPISNRLVDRGEQGPDQEVQVGELGLPTERLEVQLHLELDRAVDECPGERAQRADWACP